MRKKVYLGVLVFAILTLVLRGIPDVAAGIAARGITGVNYGPVVFPLLLAALALYQYRRQK